MLRLERGNVGDRGEYVGAVSRGTLYAIAVVDTTLAGFVVDVEILEVVVEVDGASAEIATEKGSMGGEDGGHVDVALPAEGNCDASLPFVEVSNDSAVVLTRHILDKQ